MSSRATSPLCVEVRLLVLSVGIHWATANGSVLSGSYWC